MLNSFAMYSILEWFLSVSLEGVISNESDKAVVSMIKNISSQIKDGKVINHDIQKALNRSFLESLHDICDQCLKELNCGNSTLVGDLRSISECRWLRETRDLIDKELKEVERNEQYEIMLTLDEIKSLLNQEDSMPKVFQQVNRELIRIANNIDKSAESDIPKCYKSKVENTISNLIYVHFAHEIKTNQAVSNILQAQLLGQLDIKFNTILDSISIITQQLNNKDATNQATLKMLEEIESRIVTLENGNGSKAVDSSDKFWCMCVSKNQKFYNRVDMLQKIHDYLSASEGNSIAIVGLSGLKGIGKSQLAIEYAYKHRDDYKIICWLRSETQNSLYADYLQLAKYFKISFYEGMKKAERIKLILTELENRSDWLLIFDNALKVKDIDNYLPKTNVGHVLVTSNYSSWQNMTNIEVDVFTKTDSINYILKSIFLDGTNKQLDDVSEIDKKSAEKLAIRLGYLPLALTHAILYIKSNNIKISKYLELFDKYQLDIFGELKLENYDYTVKTTVSIARKAAEISCPDSTYVLDLCAFMAPEGIPIELIKKGSDCLHGPGSQIFSADLRLNRAISCLKSYSLIQYAKETGNEILSVHRLVQLFTIVTMDNNKKGMWVESLIKTITEILPGDANRKENRDLYYQLLPHISNILMLIKKYKIQSESLNKSITVLSNKAIVFLFNTSDFRECIKYIKTKLKIYREAKDEYGIAECYTRLGTNFNRLSRYKTDLKLQNKSLSICKNKYPYLEAECYISLGKAYHNLAECKSAIEHYEKSLEIYKMIDNQQGEANCHISLGVSYYRLSDYKKAIECQKEGIRICKLIGDKQGEAKCYTNLGNANLILGNFEDAIKCHKKSIQLCREIGDRRGEATCYNNFGVACLNNGQYNNAARYLKKSISIDEQIGDRLGKLKSYGNLGIVFHKLGKLNLATEYINKSLKICLEIDDTQGEAVCCTNLGNIYYSRQKYTEAIKYLNKSLEIYEKISDREGEAKCYTYLAEIYSSLNDPKAKFRCNKKSQRIYQDIGILKDGSKIITFLGDSSNKLS